MRIATVLGARPQFIKSWAVSRVFSGDGIVEEFLIHTGQHYDRNMSQVFFESLGLKRPKYNLEVGSGSHGMQLSRMVEGLEAILQRESPDLVLVYGATNS